MRGQNTRTQMSDQHESFVSLHHRSVSLDMVHPSPRMDDRQKVTQLQKWNLAPAWRMQDRFRWFLQLCYFLSVIRPWWRKDHVHGFQLLKRCAVWEWRRLWLVCTWCVRTVGFLKIAVAESQNIQKAHYFLQLLLWKPFASTPSSKVNHSCCSSFEKPLPHPWDLEVPVEALSLGHSSGFFWGRYCFCEITIQCFQA